MKKILTLPQDVTTQELIVAVASHLPEPKRTVFIDGTAKAGFVLARKQAEQLGFKLLVGPRRY